MKYSKRPKFKVWRKYLISRLESFYIANGVKEKTPTYWRKLRAVKKRRLFFFMFFFINFTETLQLCTRPNFINASLIFIQKIKTGKTPTTFFTGAVCFRWPESCPRTGCRSSNLIDETSLADATAKRIKSSKVTGSKYQKSAGKIRLTICSIWRRTLLMFVVFFFNFLRYQLEFHRLNVKLPSIY